MGTVGVHRTVVKKAGEVDGIRSAQSGYSRPVRVASHVR